MKKFKFHILGLPHTITSHEYISCAYTQKVLKFCKMMKQKGHEILHYGHEESEVECDEMIPVMDTKILEQTYGKYNWKKEFFKHNTGDLANQIFVKRSIPEVLKRYTGDENEFLLCFWGIGHKPIADAMPKEFKAVEPGIGYPTGTFAKYKVYESYAVREQNYAINGVLPSFNDEIIPNYFDIDDFKYNDKKDDYFLYLGRIIKTKGVEIAIQVCNFLNKKLILAGQGDVKTQLGFDLPADFEHIGLADKEKRKELLAGAKGLFCPSLYSEPFGGVSIEALLSGTPVICTDWGAYAENIPHGRVGYRCKTFGEFVQAVQQIDKIETQECRKHGLKFSLETVSILYEQYFDRISKPNGFYSI